MKPSRILIGICLFLLPCVMWAQNNPPEPPAPNATGISVGPVIAGQTVPSSPPPPQMVIQRRVIGPGGPEGVVTFPLGSPGLGLGAWWKNSDIVSKLQLSEDQVKKIEQTYLDHKLKLIDLQADLEKQELRLEPLMDADRPDEAKVGTQIDLITTARGRLEKENAMMMLAIRSQLTVEQWKKLKSLEAAEAGKRNVLYWRGNAGPEAVGFPLPPSLPPGNFSGKLPEPPQP